MKHLLAVLLLSTPLVAPRAETITGVLLGQNNDIVTFDSATPGTVSATTAMTGLQPFESVLAADYLVGSSELYVFSNAPNFSGGPSEYRLRRVNPSDGTSSAIGPVHAFAGATNFSMDFLSGTGLARLTADNGMNFRLSSLDGTLTNDPVLAFAAGDPGFGNAPNVTALAAAPVTAGGTLYGIENTTDTLVTLDSDNSGVIRTVGSLGITIGAFDAICFDISTTTGTAYLSVGDNNAFSTSLYAVNLNTGAATLLGTVGSSVILRGLTVGGSGGGGGGGVDITWVGGNGLTSLVSNWNPAQAPTAVDTVYIQSGSPTVDSSVEALHLINEQNTTFNGGSFHIYSSLENAGDLFLGSDDIVFHGSPGIYRGGDIHLAGGRLMPGDINNDLFFNIGNRIEGHGLITARFNNDVDGVITANAGTLALDQPGYNDGFLNAATGGTLGFSGFQNAPFDNSGGTVRALLGGSLFLAGGLSGGHFLNQNNDPGALTGAVPGNSDQIRSPPNTGVFLGSDDSLTSVPAQFSDTHGLTTLGGADIHGDPAEFTLLPGRRLILEDSLALDGVIRAYGEANDSSTITVEGEVLLGGTGQGIELGWGGVDADFIAPGNAATNKLYLSPAASISGAGVIQADVRSIQGFIIANRVSATTGARRLAVQGNVDNFGYMRALSGGQMDVYSTTLAQWNDQVTVTGVVQCASNSTLFFVGTEILGGAIRQEDASATLRYFNGTSLNGAQGHPLTLGGTHDMVGPGGAFLDGEHDLTGEIFFESGAVLKTSTGATLNARGSTDLTGFGLVWLGADGNPGGIGPQAAASLHNFINIAGQGSVGGAGEIFNEPSARIQAHHGSLGLSGGDVWNTGAIEAGGRPVENEANVPGQLNISNRVFMSGDGLVRVNNDLSSLILSGGTLSGGTLFTRGTGGARVAEFSSATFDDLDLAGDFGVPGFSALTLDVGIIDFFPGHAFPDSYIVVGGNPGESARVEVTGSVTLRGLGGIWLKDPENNAALAKILPSGTSALLTLENDATLRGSGFVGVQVANPSGRILANEPGQKLVFMPGALLPLAQTFPVLTAGELANSPDLALPNLNFGFIEVSNAAQVVVQQALLTGLQFQMSGAGQVLLEGLNPILSNLRMHLSGTSQLVASSLLTIAHGASLSVIAPVLPGLAAGSNCDIPTLPGPVPAPKVVLKKGLLIGQDGAALIGGDGASLEVSGGDLVGQDGASIVGQDGASIVGQDGASIVGQDGASIVGQDGASIVAAGGGNIVAAGGGNIVAAGGGNIVAAGGGNIVAGGGGNIVAGGGGNIANAATGGAAAAWVGLAVGPAYGQLQVENGGKVNADAGHVYIDGGNRATTMVDNQSGGTLELKNQSCMKVPLGRVTNNGTMKTTQSNVVVGFFQNAGSAIMNGATWAWNGAVGVTTGIVNGVGGVINATGSFFGRLFGGAGQAGGGGGFALAAAGVADASDFINDGTIILGDTICTNTFDMGFTQTATGKLSVQLAGTVSNKYDRLFINGPTVLGGVLQLVFTNNFAPTLGDTFDFLVCPDLVSDFDSVEILGLPAGHNWQHHAVVTPGGYRIVSDSTVGLPTPLADFRTLHGLAANGSQDYANPSGDLVPNLFKYAFNLASAAGDLNVSNDRRMNSPADTSGLPALFRTGPGVFEFVYVRRKASTFPGIAYIPEISTSLESGWVDLAPAAAAVESIDATWERVRMTLAAPFEPPHEGGGDLRVRVEKF